MKWKSPRCSAACWDEIKEHDALLSKAMEALANMRRDRDEWKEQHENLLAMYRAAVSSKDHSEPADAFAMREVLKETREQLIKVRDAINKSGALNGREYDGLGLETNVVISRAWHALNFGEPLSTHSRPNLCGGGE